MSLADAVDAALEWSVVGSFTRIGSATRRRLEHWAPVTAGLDRQVVVLTGATSGLGRVAAHALARLGATLEIVARDATRAAALVDELRVIAGHDRVRAVIADTGDLAAVRRAAVEIMSRHRAIAALLHNAGALDDVRRVSVDGIEQTVASQVVGPHLLTTLLVPALVAGSPSRVVWVSSGGMYSEALDVAHLEMPAAGYDGTTAYARAKRAQIALVEEWSTRLRDRGVAVHAMHPGWADTPGVARSLPMFRRIVGPLLRTPADGADTLVWLAAGQAPPATTGGFWLDRRRRPTHRLARTRAADTADERARLWAWVESKAGL